MLPAAATRAVRVLGCICTFAIVFISVPALRAQNGQTAAASDRRGHAQLRPRGAVDHAEGQPAGVRHQRDAAMARHGRSLLVLVPDPRRAPLLHRRSPEEGQNAPLRPREDGGRTDDDYAHSLRRAEPSVQHRQVRQEGHGLRVQLPGAGQRRHPLDQAPRDDDRAAAVGDQRRRRREQWINKTTRARTPRSRRCSSRPDGRVGVADGAAAATRRRPRRATKRSTSSTTWRPRG